MCVTLLGQLSAHQTIYLDQIFRLAFSAIKTAAQTVTHVLRSSRTGSRTHSRRGKNYFKFHMVSRLISKSNLYNLQEASWQELAIKAAPGHLYAIMATATPVLVNHMKLWGRAKLTGKVKLAFDLWHG